MTGTVPVLMYHSISGAAGPTSIDPDTFHGQMEGLAAQGYEAVTLQDFAAWYDGGADLPPRSVVITFDDGFADFAEHAAPEMISRGWSATVFLPTGHVGGMEQWHGGNQPARPLMNWRQVVELAAQGIAFGGHSVSHVDLTTLNSQDLDYELRQSRDAIEAHLGSPPISFAPPYGRCNTAVRAAITKWYRVSFGTRLQRASRATDILDVARIEMHYFRSRARWEAFLDGRSDLYFDIRRLMRSVRQIAIEPRRG